MILIAGGTGRLGSLLVARLTAADHAVRVLTRDATRAQHLESYLVEVVVGDVRDPASLTSAVEGADTVVSAVHGFAGPGRVTPASVDRDGNAALIDTARRVGAAVVLMSVVGAAPDSTMELFRAKYAAEQHLRGSNDTDWTIVRATAFIELWADIMAKPIVFGRGDNPINFVSVGDVAAVVERAVLDPRLRGQVLEVGGPQSVTFNEFARILQDQRGSSAKARHVPRTILRALAPFNRQPRAGLAMDTVDFTFAAETHRAGFDDLPFTDVATALNRHAGPPPRRPQPTTPTA
jgi:uncharacterized protein YbjT (DUF2867 family)